MRLNAIALGIVAACASQAALAVPFVAIRIGDVDGFGFTTDVPLLNAASGADADTNGNGLLQQTEFLPDLDGGGTVQYTGQAVAGGPFLGFDDFDNRSAAERTGSSVTGSGDFVNRGTAGSDFTDISLSASYDPILVPGGAEVYHSPGTLAPGAFPSSPSTTLPNQPGFQFRFDVLKTNIDSAQDIFFNVLFGDYDVVPAVLNITTNSGSNSAGSIVALDLFTQPLAADGLIQASFVTLNFFQVFSDSGGLYWNGFLNVDFNAPNEPYTAFDFVELSTRPIPTQPEPVPEPASWALLGAGLLPLLLRRRRAAA